MMSKIKGVLFALYFLITVAILIALMYIFKSKNRELRRSWCKYSLKLFGIKIVIEGKRDREAKFLMLNHQSMLDILVLEAIEADNLCWIAKKEIAKVPLYGHILKAPKMIELDRANKRGLIKLLSDVKERLADNRVIAIFPEGTRGDGKKLLKFKDGSKMIANKFNLKVQPIVVFNTIKGLDSKKLKQSSATVTIKYLDSKLADKKSDWYRDIEKEMREVYESTNSLSNR